MFGDGGVVDGGGRRIAGRVSTCGVGMGASAMRLCVYSAVFLFYFVLVTVVGI